VALCAAAARRACEGGGRARARARRCRARARLRKRAQLRSHPRQGRRRRDALRCRPLTGHAGARRGAGAPARLVERAPRLRRRRFLLAAGPAPGRALLVLLLDDARSARRARPRLVAPGARRPARDRGRAAPRGLATADPLASGRALERHDAARSPGHGPPRRPRAPGRPRGRGPAVLPAARLRVRDLCRTQAGRGSRTPRRRACIQR
jgi:hypothetical protein